MEFTNEIFFNKSLTADETVIITYCGKLYREHSEEISIVYGFGDNWEYTTESPMKEIENGFEATIELKDYNTFNFCFKNNYNIWDNNFGFNYISPISAKPEVPANNSIIDSANTNETSESETIEATVSNEEIVENNIDDIDEIDTTKDGINDDIDNNTSNNSNTESSSISGTVENEEEITEEASAEAENTEESKQDFELNNASEVENVFSALLDSILDMKACQNENIESIDINSLEDFGLKSVDEIKEEDFVNCDEIFKEFYEELSNIPTEKLETPKSTTTQDELENLFNSLFQSDTETNQTVQNIETNYDNFETEELDNLMDNILSSIINSDGTNDTEASSPVEQFESNIEEETQEDISVFEATQNSDDIPTYSELPALKSDSLFDKFIDSSYRLFKKAQVACKKLGTLIKLKAQEYGIIKEK